MRSGTGVPNTLERPLHHPHHGVSERVRFTPLATYAIHLPEAAGAERQILHLLHHVRELTLHPAEVVETTGQKSCDYHD